MTPHVISPRVALIARLTDPGSSVTVRCVMHLHMPLDVLGLTTDIVVTIGAFLAASMRTSFMFPARSLVGVPYI